MSLGELRRLLVDPARPGSPEPTLLPWLAARVPRADLPILATVAAAWSEPGVGWPVVADAVADVIATRLRDTGGLAAAVRALPPVAGRLRGSQLTLLDWDEVGFEALAYAAMADRTLFPAAIEQAPDDRWRIVLAAASGSDPPPPLADVDSLIWLASGPDDRAPLPGDRVVYLLPSGDRWASTRPSTATVLAAVESVLDRPAWFSAAVVARAAPYLGDRRGDVTDLVAGLSPPWAGHAGTLLARPRRPWSSPTMELAASHFAIPALTELAATVEPAELADLCLDTAAHIGYLDPATVRTEPRLLPQDPVEETPGRAGKRRIRSSRRHEGPAGGSPTRVVSTGLASPETPDLPWDADRCPGPDSDYLYWFMIGPSPLPGAVDERPTEVTLPPDAGAGTVLTVALFAYGDEVGIVPGQDVGQLVVGAGGSIEVHRQPGVVDGDRLFFPIRTPSRPGRHRLRCNLYCRQVLLQSRVLQLEVRPGSPRQPRAVRSTIDYLVDATLDAGSLAGIEVQALSVFVNDDAHGTHGFRFFVGDGVVKTSTVLREGALQNQIQLARNALAKAAWGSAEPWREGLRFRYDGRRESGLAGDLINLARVGRQLWVSIGGGVATNLGPGPDRLRAPITVFADLLRKPATIELASKQDAALVVPIGLFYDYPLDTQAELSACATALGAIGAGRDLAGEPCFRGHCPEQGDGPTRGRIVCPGGFWGFRHRIGLPQSAYPTLAAAPPIEAGGDGNRTIAYSGRPCCIVGVAAEFDGPHPRGVCSRGNAASRVYVDRDELLTALRPGSSPHLVYFYCHGDISPGGIPGLMVGRTGTPAITFSEIAGGDMYWPDTRPLVVLNGCRTAAVEPRYAMTLVDAFVTRAGASGVIGTEITTHERLAARFGDAMLDALLTDGVPLAEAMRRARLALLAEGNPLGLVYVAYAAPQLRLVSVASTP